MHPIGKEIKCFFIEVNLSIPDNFIKRRLETCLSKITSTGILSGQRNKQ